jgi:hypothetical protein
MPRKTPALLRAERRIMQLQDQMKIHIAATERADRAKDETIKMLTSENSRLKASAAEPNERLESRNEELAQTVAEIDSECDDLKDDVLFLVRSLRKIKEK